MDVEGMDIQLTTKLRLAACICLIETLVTMQYNVIITAANDIVADKAPTGLVLFAYSIPSILTRVIVPLIRFPESTNYPILSLFGSSRSGDSIDNSTSLTKEINYPLRLIVCAASSGIGLQLLAHSNNIGVLILGIMLAALSSNLGDMSLQMLCARYPTSSKFAFGGYTAGSGFSASLGAFSYTYATSQMRMKYTTAFSIYSIAPLIALLAYAFMLPEPEGAAATAAEEEQEGIVRLPWKDKLRIIRPMFVPYMLPLATIFFIENAITQGIFPTLLYYVPIKNGSFFLARFFNGVFHETRDFYPLYLSVNQLSSFIGRLSFWLFRLPGGSSRSTRAYWALVYIETFALILQLSNSLSMKASPLPDAPESSVLYGPMGVISLAGIQGLAAGMVFCNTYWKILKKPLPSAVYDALDHSRARIGLQERRERANSEEEAMGLLTVSDDVPKTEREHSDSEETALREFLLSTIAPPDVISVALASIVGMALQKSLCDWQSFHGRELCAKMR
ncbi:CLN3 protein-domain-containing protein [Pyronema omphalodes]|nr:CLN3 protein-domain-containing protein [Pyronema omphalodes]